MCKLFTAIGKYLFIIFWFVLCYCLLIEFMNDQLVGGNQEITELFVMKMLFITMPSGIIVWSIGSVRYMVVPWLSFGDENEIIFRWFLLMMVGYLQWFVVVPFYIKKILCFFIHRAKRN